MARVQAVRRLADKVPVTGRVVFVGDVEFQGGRVPGAVTLAELEDEFGVDPDEPATPPNDAVRGLWQKIDEASRRYAV